MENVKEYTYILDGEEIDKLEMLWRYVAEHPIVAARELFPTKPNGFVMTTKMLGSLAFLRSSAVKMRLVGDVASARYYEETFERIYNQLPEFAKW